MRTVFIIPLMYTRDNLSRINPELPEDFDPKSQEFWNYVGEKLNSPVSIQKIFFDSLTKEKMPEALEFVKKGNGQAFDVIEKLKKESGAELQTTEDSILLQESASWAQMLNTTGATEATEQLFAEAMADREKFVAKTVSESLKEGEMAALFLSPGRRTGDYFPTEIRMIKIQPFDPNDYLNSWLVSLNLKSRGPPK